MQHSWNHVLFKKKAFLLGGVRCSAFRKTHDVPQVYHKDRNSEEGGKEGGNSAFSDEGGSREEEAATREERGGVETVGRQIKVALYETCIKELRGDH